MKVKILSYTILCLLANNVCSAAEEIAVQEKVKKAYELYLQDQSVTLSNNQWRVGADVSYTSDERTILFNHQESRSVQGGLSVNYGLTDKIEIFVRAPIVYNKTSVKDAFGLTDETESSTNFGNVSVGGSATILKLNNGPTITLQTNFSLPTSTGNSSINRTAVTAGVTLYQDFDPAFLYGGLHGTKTLGGDEFDGFSYQAGFGFSLNHRLAIGAELSGGYKFTPQVLASSESAFLTGNATFALNQKNIIQPSVSFGLNESSPDFILGLQWTRLF
ncbi:MAG: hypothetical protein RLZZ230_857 [Candidatus Parcubacteria bacterium]|jgi:hypothetical protein